MRTQRHLDLSVPIPGNVPPRLVLSALHTFVALIQHDALMIRYEEIPAPPDLIDTDPFFAPWDASVRAFDVQEAIAMAPGLVRQFKHWCVFQPHQTGVRSRAHATAGIILWTYFEVRPRQAAASPAGSESTGSTAFVESDEYELHESVILEANSLLMPFITTATVKNHGDIVRRVVDEVARNYLGGLPRAQQSTSSK